MLIQPVHPWQGWTGSGTCHWFSWGCSYHGGSKGRG